MKTLSCTFVVVTILGASTVLAGWTDPVCHSELNDFAFGYVGFQPCISSDGLSIFFVREVPHPDTQAHYQLFEAVREDVSESFTSERGLWELNPQSVFINNPWISTDGLRLYYGEATQEEDRWGGYSFVKMATRNSLSEAWLPSRILSELHMPFTTDLGCTLTKDELVIMWMAKRPTPDDEYRVYMATRTSVDEPFSNEIEVTELNAVGVHNPHLSGDGLRVYFAAARPDNGLGNLYRMTRPSLDEPFGNLEHLEGLTNADAGGSSPHLSPDERTIYFHGSHGQTGVDKTGIWVSHWDCSFQLAGDLDDDCRVGLSDLAIMAGNWLKDCFLTPDDPACVPK